MSDEQEAASPEEELFNEWLQHPTTKALRAIARRDFEQLKDDWAAGRFSAATEHERATKDANALGKCEILDGLVNIDFDFFAEQNDGTDKRTTPPYPL